MFSFLGVELLGSSPDFRFVRPVSLPPLNQSISLHNSSIFTNLNTEWPNNISSINKDDEFYLFIEKD